MQVAETFEWSLSKINRIESGEVTVSNTDLQALLRLYDISDGIRADRLMNDARASRRRGWWDKPEYREFLTTQTLQLLQFESQASAIRVFQVSLVPGILQTRNYAESLIGSADPTLSHAQQATRLAVRLERAAQVFSRPDPPQYYLVIDESVPFRTVGGPKIMAEQLEQLLDYIKRSIILVRVLPFAEGALTVPLGPFTILDLGDEENAVLYRESSDRDEITHTPKVVLQHRDTFEHMWKLSLSPEASTRLIEARVAEMLSSLDRRQRQV
jgi:hypothetical protein